MIPRKSATRKDRSRRPSARLAFEQLEDRRLLSGQPVASAFHTNYVRYLPAGQVHPADGGSTIPDGLTPVQVRTAYGLPQVTFSNGTITGDGSGQTIAIVDAYDDPTIAADLHSFDVAFGLPDPPSFKRVAQDGTTNYPTTDPSGSAGEGDDTWEVEEALDVEWAHALAPKANILLVEAKSDSPYTNDLYTAVVYAKSQPGVVVVSMSWGGGEDITDLGQDNATFAQPSGGHAPVTFVAATGDDGEPGGYPAYSTNVVAVGGTTLTSDDAGNYQGEVGWSGSGGGISQYELLPSYQQGVVTQSTTHRANPDVSFDADPDSGVDVYDSYDYGSSAPWATIGGTSLATPSWAGLIAVADQGRATVGSDPMSSLDTLNAIYTMSSGTFNSANNTKPATDFIDITSGNNGNGNSNTIYNAGPGYDLVTGRGSPNAPYLINDFVGTFQVLSSSPDSGEVVRTPPTSFVVNFSDPYQASSVAAASFQVNGIGADSLTLTSPTTVTYTFANSPVTTPGTQTMSIGDGSILEQTTNTSLSDFSSTFIYDTLPPLTVTSTTPAAGATLATPPTSLVVHFNEAYDPVSIGVTNLTLSQGTVTAATPTDATTVTYALSGVTTDGAISTVTIPAGAITDEYGGYGPDFSETIIVEAGSQPFPTPLIPVTPAGSLVYQNSVTAAIAYDGDTDPYTISLAAGQTLTAQVAAFSGLQAKITLTGPGGSTSASATDTGAAVILQTAPITTAGVYTLTVSGLNDTIDGYTLNVYLNAALSTGAFGGASNNTLATAQNIDGSFTALGGGPQRGAVEGQIAGTLGPDKFGYSAIAVAPQFVDISSTGRALNFSNDDDADTAVTPGSGFTFSFYGTTYTKLFVSTNGLITFGSGDSDSFNDDLTDDPTQAAIAPLWDDLIVEGQSQSNVYWKLAGSGSSQQLIVQWNDVSFYEGNDTGLLTFEAILSANGTILLNYKNLESGDFSDDGATATVGIKAPGDQTTAGKDLLVSYYAGPNQFVGSNLSTEIGVGLGTTDYYAFTLTAGQTATLAATSQGALPVQVALEDGQGNTLATGTALTTTVNSAIDNYVVTKSGTYYAVVSGAGDTPYTLVVTRNADFDTKTGTSLATAQNISGTQGVLGDILAAAPQDWYKLNLGTTSNLSLQTYTPGSAASQFVDNLQPQIKVYDSSDNLLASGTGSPNQSLSLANAPPGTYYISVTGASGSIGEYFLSTAKARAAAWKSVGAWTNRRRKRGLVRLILCVTGAARLADCSRDAWISTRWRCEPTGTPPWNDLTTISVVFSQDVIVNTSQAALGLAGSPDLPMPSSLGGAKFSYDSGTDTATWTFSAPLTTDKFLLAIPSAAVANMSGIALDGEWTNASGSTPGGTFPSGDGTPGGDFSISVIKVLPGIASGDGVVTGRDGTIVQKQLQQTTAMAGYSALDDFDGDGTITSADSTFLRSQLLKRLPTTEPSPPSAPQHASAVASSGSAAEPTTKPAAATVAKTKNTPAPIVADPMEIAARISASKNAKKAKQAKELAAAAPPKVAAPKSAAPKAVVPANVRPAAIAAYFDLNSANQKRATAGASVAAPAVASSAGGTGSTSTSGHAAPPPKSQPAPIVGGAAFAAPFGAAGGTAPDDSLAAIHDHLLDDRRERTQIL